MAITTIIKSNGTVLPIDRYDLQSIDTSKEFNRIPMAEIKLYDGHVATQELKTLDDEAFAPGTKIEISIKGGNNIDAEKIFEGLVINLELEKSLHHSLLTIELSDVAIKMTSVRNNEVYQKKTDKKIIKSLVEKYGFELSMPDPPNEEDVHGQMVQYYASDWDFMLSRTEANGQLIAVDDGVISVMAPEEKTPTLSLIFGKDLIDFNLKLCSNKQFQKVNAFALNEKKEVLQLTTAKKGKENIPVAGNYDLSKIATTIGAEQVSLIHPVPLLPFELQYWSNAQILKSRLSLVQGVIKTNGNAKLKVGQTINIEKVSRFNGNYIISGVRQIYTKNTGWYTYIQIGMDANWSTSRSDIVDAQAAGLLPGVNGLQVGTVKGYPKDTALPFRVLVTIPSFNQSHAPLEDQELTEVLAIYTSLDAGVDHGVFLPPEIGDRVVVGFLNDDPRQAVILGSMQSNKFPNNEKNKNSYRGIFTKSNYQLLFDEESEIVTLSTADSNNEHENKISINQNDKRIQLEDAHGNKIELHEGGITMSSTKDFTMDVTGNFNLKTTGTVKIEGKTVDLK